MPIQRIIKLIDFILAFNIILFFSGAINQFGENQGNVILFLAFGTFNIFFLIGIVRLRIHYNRELIKDIEFEAKAEEMIVAEDRERFRKTKQIHLENIIVVKMEEAFPKMKIIRNAYVRQKDGKDTQIDVIALHRQGIFVIEAKNLTGEILGDWKSDTLTINQPGKEKFSLYNPIKQNAMHVERISSLLGMNQKDIKNIVVFGGRTHISSFEGVPSHTRVTFRETLVGNMKKLMKHSKTIISDGEIQKIYDDLNEHTKVDKQREQDHMENVKSKIRSDK